MSFNRPDQLRKLNETFDICIIGGGATGAGVKETCLGEGAEAPGPRMAVKHRCGDAVVDATARGFKGLGDAIQRDAYGERESLQDKDFDPYFSYGAWS